MNGMTRQIVFAWIKERGRNVGVVDVMQAFRINRNNANKFLLSLSNAGALEPFRGHRGVYKLTGKSVELARRRHPNSMANLEIGRKRAPDPNRLKEDGKPLWWPDAPELCALWTGLGKLT